MSPKLTKEFVFQICSIVDEIPAGKVATYGQIAALSGYEKSSRLVGRALSISSTFGNYPCHRVVNSNGELVKGWNEQKELLYKEGILFKENGNVDLKIYKWTN